MILRLTITPQKLEIEEAFKEIFDGKDFLDDASFI